MVAVSGFAVSEFAEPHLQNFADTQHITVGLGTRVFVPVAGLHVGTPEVDANEPMWTMFLVLAGE